MRQLTFYLYTTNTTPDIVIIERKKSNRQRQLCLSVRYLYYSCILLLKLWCKTILSPGTIQCSSGDSCSEGTYWYSSETVGGRSHCQLSEQGDDKYFSLCILSSYIMIAVVLFWEIPWNAWNWSLKRDIPPLEVGGAVAFFSYSQMWLIEQWRQI